MPCLPVPKAGIQPVKILHFSAHTRASASAFPLTYRFWETVAGNCGFSTRFKLFYITYMIGFFSSRFQNPLDLDLSGHVYGFLIADDYLTWCWPPPCSGDLPWSPSHPKKEMGTRSLQQTSHTGPRLLRAMKTASRLSPNAAVTKHLPGKMERGHVIATPPTPRRPPRWQPQGHL